METKVKLNKTLISPKPTKSRLAKPSKSPFNNCLISNYLEDGEWIRNNSHKLLGLQLHRIIISYFNFLYWNDILWLWQHTMRHLRKGEQAKKNPTRGPLNHSAPRWRALRKERTGKPHERIKPNPEGKLSSRQKHEDGSRH